MRIVSISNKFSGLKASLNRKRQTWRKVSGVSATLLITSLFLAAPVATRAAAAFPPPPNGVSICTYLNNGNFCLTGEGTGVQIQTTLTGGSAWDFTSATTGYKIHSHNFPTVCLQGFGSPNSNQVKEETCQQGNGQQEWEISGSVGHYTMFNVSTGGVMGVFDVNSDRPVYDNGAQNGYYYNWQS